MKTLGHIDYDVWQRLMLSNLFHSNMNDCKQHHYNILKYYLCIIRFRKFSMWHAVTVFYYENVFQQFKVSIQPICIECSDVT